jgi:cation diffusion facilitator CzcD-associated flavoprotein CzcO
VSGNPTTEHLDVLIVGAGLSGVCAGHYLRTDCPWASWAIFEARDSMGGTWDLFRYPGVRSDSDMFTLGFPFRPWQSARMIAEGSDILQYIKDTAAEEGIDRNVRFAHRVTGASWSTDDACWHVTAVRTDTGEAIELTCGFLLSCGGYYRYDRGYQPDFVGADRFEGPIIHPQFWPEGLDTSGKRIAVIGSGATAVTLVPSLARTAAHVTMVQRSPTYVASVPATNPLVAAVQQVLPDRTAATTVRWLHALGTQGMYGFSQRYPSLVKRLLRLGLRLQLPRGYDVDTHFTPRYNPWDERMCVVPGGDLFKAIASRRATVVTDHIDAFTERGLRLQSGSEVEADIIVTATGLELQFVGGIDLVVDGEPVDLADRLTYKGMMLEGVPNLALAIGYTNASWTLKCDLTCQYVCRLLNHLRSTRLRQCTPVNRDVEVVAEPLLDLQSGYIQRAADRLPQQGSKFPWRVYQSFLADYRATKLKSVDDGVMQFSNPMREPIAAAS